MKKRIQFGLLFLFALVSYATPLLAQFTEDEALIFLKKYETAYNKKDDQALKAMHTDNSIRTLADGTVNTGSEAIRLALLEDFKADPLTLTIKQDKIATAPDGSGIATGTYHAWGEGRPGDKFDVKGSYSITIVKEKGEWKISKTVLSYL